MIRIDKNKIQQLEKELKDLVVSNHQYKKREPKEDLKKGTISFFGKIASFC